MVAICHSMLGQVGHWETGKLAPFTGKNATCIGTNATFTILYWDIHLSIGYLRFVLRIFGSCLVPISNLDDLTAGVR